MEGSGYLQVQVAFPLPQARPPVPIEQKAEWAPDPVWTRLRSENTPAPAQNRTLIIQPVALSLHRLSYSVVIKPKRWKGGMQRRNEKCIKNFTLETWN
jgi:hypothetical protein